MLNIPIVIAFFAGIVSFLSPCILPIIPGFLAYLGGASSENVEGGKARWGIFLNSLFFVIGFSIVFAVLGVLLNGVLAHAAYSVQTWLSWIGGVVIIFFGLYLMGFFRIGFLEYEHKLNPKIQFHSRYLTSLLFGFAFAAGWTPCVGPVLGGILGLVASSPGEAFPRSFLCFGPRRAVPRGRGVRGAGGALDKSLCHRAPLCDARVWRDTGHSRHPRFHPGPDACGELRIREQSSSSKIKFHLDGAKRGIAPKQAGK